MIVVTGATGNVGRALVDQLLAEAAPVRALSRHPERAGLPAQAETVRARFGEGEPLEPLLDGADALFLNPAAASGDAAAGLIDAAAKSGVRRIVLLSSASITDTPDDEQHFISRMHLGIERAIRDSGLEWTFVRGGMFATNTLQWAEQIRHGDVVRGPYADAVAAPVHEKDLAAVAAAALLDRVGAHDGAVYVVTGPEGLTTAEQVAAVGRAVGRDLRYEELPRDAALQAMSERQGIPREVAESLLDYFAATVGRPAHISHDVERVVGRTALTYTQWAADHAADFTA
ncbi:NAD(P)H-binding protein [Streptomyces sp. RB6PN25]|uniref:NAD(P)H-binding protein n=1 Tax=Streptomyces humicola TaxID=2953240 RepID=A0ABT1Q3X2_9ACTN|nr:NAD(P)H-binding protein [Streptomyces humicola]MCQ4084621.1 NAD(P)H-binding protein [Streptomyces humicola]